MTERERQQAIQAKLCRLAVRAPSMVPSGFPALDRALGGGFPRRGMVELFGPPSSGKTTLALQAVAHAQSQGLWAAWIDADGTFDPAWASGLGVNIARLAVAQPAWAEQALEIARSLALTGALDLVVVDSAAALVPKLELDTAIGESGWGLQTRIVASGLRRLAGALARAEVAALFLNQTRGRPDAEGGEETSAGGPPLKLYAAARIALDGVAEAGVRFRVLKNRPAAAFAGGQLAWNRGSGFAKPA
jgi:recombination protein RecA